MRWIKSVAIAVLVIARFGRSYGSLDYLGWTELFDDLVAAMEDES